MPACSLGQFQEHCEWNQCSGSSLGGEDWGLGVKMAEPPARRYDQREERGEAEKRGGALWNKEERLRGEEEHSGIPFCTRPPWSVCLSSDGRVDTSENDSGPPQRRGVFHVHKGPPQRSRWNIPCSHWTDIVYIWVCSCILK